MEERKVKRPGSRPRRAGSRAWAPKREESRVIPAYGSSHRNLGEIRRRNKRLILAVLLLLVILVYAMAIRQRTEKPSKETEEFPPEKWTIVAPDAKSGEE
jgi:hypothetical protein